MEFKDYYTIMGLARDATQDDIKRAYRKLARKYHPDVSKEADAEDRFKEVGEAYEVLKNPEKRAAYDQLGENWKSGEEFHPPPDWDAGFEFHGGGTEGMDEAAFSDFFESLFGHASRTSPGQHSRQQYEARGEDHHAKVLIDIVDSYRGAKRTISLRTPELDDSGHLVLKNRSLNVQIPKGVKQGQRIRLAGQGAKGFGSGKPGDLYLEIEFKPHPLYRVQQRDVYLELPVTPWEAALGGKIKVPTPDAPVELTLPPNTSTGSKLRLKGKGIPGKPPGDIYVIPKVILPDASSEKARELYETMKVEMAFNPRSHLEV